MSDYFKFSFLVLFDDGSLGFYTHSPASHPPKSPGSADSDEPIPVADVLKYSDKKMKFPITVFETLDCITPSVTYGGDLLDNYSQEIIKQKLSTQDDHLVLTKSSGSKGDNFKIIIKNPNPSDTVLAGVRIFVGHHSLDNIPSQFQIFNRTISTIPGTKRWYDIPFSPLGNYPQKLFFPKYQMFNFLL